MERAKFRVNEALPQPPPAPAEHHRLQKPPEDSGRGANGSLQGTQRRSVGSPHFPAQAEGCLQPGTVRGAKSCWYLSPGLRRPGAGSPYFTVLQMEVYLVERDVREGRASSLLGSHAGPDYWLVGQKRLLRDTCRHGWCPGTPPPPPCSLCCPKQASSAHCRYR